MDHSSHAPHAGEADPAVQHQHQHQQGGGLTAMAASATLHCLTGCAIGEILGLVIGTSLGWASTSTFALSVSLAFAFGYMLSTFPLLRAGLAVGAALRVVLAADTLSILTMEVVDNLVMATVPGAMEARLDDPLFWVSMGLALLVAFGAALPVNRWLLARGKGHALTHEFHHGSPPAEGLRRLIPNLPTVALATGIVAFLAGGWLVAVVEGEPTSGVPQHESARSDRP